MVSSLAVKKALLDHLLLAVVSSSVPSADDAWLVSEGCFHRDSPSVMEVNELTQADIYCYVGVRETPSLGDLLLLNRPARHPATVLFLPSY